jgi:hypothetical protein
MGFFGLSVKLITYRPWHLWIIQQTPKEDVGIKDDHHRASHLISSDSKMSPTMLMSPFAIPTGERFGLSPLGALGSETTWLRLATAVPSNPGLHDQVLQDNFG